MNWPTGHVRGPQLPRNRTVRWCTALRRTLGVVAPGVKQEWRVSFQPLNAINPPVNIWLEEYVNGTRHGRYRIGVPEAGGGEWLFTQVGLTRGARIEGSFSGQLYRL